LADKTDKKHLILRSNLFQQDPLTFWPRHPPIFRLMHVTHDVEKIYCNCYGVKVNRMLNLYIVLCIIMIACIIYASKQWGDVIYGMRPL